MVCKVPTAITCRDQRRLKWPRRSRDFSTDFRIFGELHQETAAFEMVFEVVKGGRPKRENASRCIAARTPIEWKSGRSRSSPLKVRCSSCLRCQATPGIDPHFPAANVSKPFSAKTNHPVTFKHPGPECNIIGHWNQRSELPLLAKSSYPHGCRLLYALFAENAPAVKSISALLMRIRRAASGQ